MIAKFIRKNRIFKIGYFDHVYRFILVIFFCLILSGCCLVNVAEKNQLETNDLEAGEKAFFQKKYKDADTIFRSIIDRSKDTGLKNIALYNLACTKLVTSETEQEFIEATKLLSKWNPSKEGKVYFENPLLIIQALWKTAEMNKKERLENSKKNEELNTIVKHQNKEIFKMEQTIQNLQHQISELENIDQEIQEKRKTN